MGGSGQKVGRWQKGVSVIDILKQVISKDQMKLFKYFQAGDFNHTREKGIP